MKKTPFIGIAGNIGVGKTTFTEVLAKKYNWDEYYESVIDNPYLSDFYGDMKQQDILNSKLPHFQTRLIFALVGS